LGDFLGAVMTRFVPDTLRFDVRSLTVEGDRAVLEWGVTARTITGKAYDNSYLAVFELGDGRIAQVREYADTQHIADVMFA
jgi:ketosteroid isomerase-like protein